MTDEEPGTEVAGDRGTDHSSEPSPFPTMPPGLRARHLPSPRVDAPPGEDDAPLVEAPSAVIAAPTSAGAEIRRHPDWRLIAALSAVGVLLLAAGWFAYASHANEKSAADWKQRAIGLGEQVNGLRTLIGERSAQLNERTRQANRLAGNLRSTRVARDRSAGDVPALARRQRELANEKAQLEDQRRALQRQAADLEDIATRYIGCKDSLIDVITSLVYDDYTTAKYQADIAQSRCDSAAAALNAYVAAYS